jgi:hypothetical protein
VLAPAPKPRAVKPEPLPTIAAATATAPATLEAGSGSGGGEIAFLALAGGSLIAGLTALMVRGRRRSGLLVPGENPEDHVERD